jgi:hypothetical protein
MKPEMSGTVQCHRYRDVPWGLYKGHQGPSSTTSSSTLTFPACLISHLPIRTLNLSEESVKVHRVIGPTVGGTPPSLSILLSSRVKRVPRAATEISYLGLSSTSTIIRSSTYSISIGWLVYNAMMTKLIYPRVPQEAVDGLANIGGVRSYAFAENGDTSYLGHHPTCAFVSSTQVAPP